MYTALAPSSNLSTQTREVLVDKLQSTSGKLTLAKKGSVPRAGEVLVIDRGEVYNLQKELDPAGDFIESIYVHQC